MQNINQLLDQIVNENLKAKKSEEEIVISLRSNVKNIFDNEDVWKKEGYNVSGKITYYLPLEDNSRLCMVFEKDVIKCFRVMRDEENKKFIVTLKDTRDGKKTPEGCIINYYDDEKLDTVCDILNKYKIGPHYTNEFKKDIKNVYPGELLVFDSGKAFLCTEKAGDKIELKAFDFDVEKANVFAFRDAVTISIDTSSEKDLQGFYSSIRKNFLSTVCTRSQILTDAQAKLQKLETSILSEDGDKLNHIDIGPFSFTVIKYGKELLWYDNATNERVKREDLKVAIAWLQSEPVKTIVNDEKSAAIDKNINSALIFSALENMILESDGQSDACLEAAIKIKDLSERSLISTSMIIQDNDEFKGISIDAYRGELYIAHYDNADFKGAPIDVEPVSVYKMAEIFREKVESIDRVYRDEFLEEVRSNYPNAQIESNPTIKQVENAYISRMKALKEDHIFSEIKTEDKIKDRIISNKSDKKTLPLSDMYSKRSTEDEYSER